MKVDIEGNLMKLREMSFESWDGLRSLTLDFMSGEVRAFRYTRPHINASFRWDCDKHFHSSIAEALEKHSDWLNRK